MNRARFCAQWIVLAPLLVILPQAGWACNSPLVLDLDGDGLYTTGADRGVRFDLDGDGIAERCGWIDPYEDDAFLWLDLNHNRQVDSGRELFGDSTATPDGSSPTNGFDALAIFDQLEFGGNGDRAITPDDLIWSSLRLWSDKNYDGVSAPREITTLDDWGIKSISLKYRRRLTIDGNDNVHAFWGRFRRSPGVDLDIVDIFFQTIEK